jgi:hypothetical protein
MERTDEQPKSQYISKRDIKVFGLALLGLAILLSPVYFVLKENSDSYICKRNMQAIAKAVMLYSAENNDRLPPAYVTMDGVTPFVENGGVYTWAYLVQPQMKRGASFQCPKASEAECYVDHDSETGKPMLVSYGMYLPMGGMPISSISNPESAILITETSSLGSEDTFDPHPLKDADGNLVKDGFIVTWSTGNLLSEDPVNAVTRLAFSGTKTGEFKKDGRARHPDGNHFITVNGASVSLPPTAARVEWDTKRKKIVGRWMVPDAALLDINR